MNDCIPTVARASSAPLLLADEFVAHLLMLPGVISTYIYTSCVSISCSPLLLGPRLHAVCTDHPRLRIYEEWIIHEIVSYLSIPE